MWLIFLISQVYYSGVLFCMAKKKEYSVYVWKCANVRMKSRAQKPNESTFRLNQQASNGIKVRISVSPNWLLCWLTTKNTTNVTLVFFLTNSNFLFCWGNKVVQVIYTLFDSKFFCCRKYEIHCIECLGS